MNPRHEHHFTCKLVNAGEEIFSATTVVFFGRPRDRFEADNAGTRSGESDADDAAGDASGGRIVVLLAHRSGMTSELDSLRSSSSGSL